MFVLPLGTYGLFNENDVQFVNLHGLKIPQAVVTLKQRLAVRLLACECLLSIKTISRHLLYMLSDGTDAH